MTRRSRFAVSLVLTGALSLIAGVMAIEPGRFGLLHGSWSATATWTGKPTSGTFPNGPLALWGATSNGQNALGAIDQGYPVRVGTLNYSSVSTRNDVTCAVQTNDALWCWGDNRYGQVGNTATALLTLVPTREGTTGSFTRVAVGGRFVCAIVKTALTMSCWGQNGNGELGLAAPNDLQPRTTPTSLGPDMWSAVTAGSAFACGIKTDDTLLCWGDNGSGQLGIGNTTTVTTPATAVGGTWSAVTAGSGHACGLRKTDSTLWCWGGNAYGQLGIGSTAGQTSPVQIGSATWATVAAGTESTCGVRTGGTLWCWGHNDSGQLGVGDLVDRTAPVQVGAATTWTGVTPGENHTCGRHSTTVLWCWGSSAAGQLGNGDTESRTTPKEVVGATTWTQSAGGAGHRCAIKSGGSLWCWGDNAHGQLGLELGSRPAIHAPRTEAGPFTKIAAGSPYVCGIRTDTTLWCWGNNTRGQLGVGDALPRYVPTQVAGSWIDIAAGWDHTCGIQTGNKAYCWGRDNDGRSGVGFLKPAATYDVNPLPEEALGGAVWKRLGLGAYNSCGIRTDDTLYCWGATLHGSIGDGITYGTTGAALSMPTPRLVTTPGNTAGFRSVSGGDYYQCAVKLDGTLWCWGWNTNGQIGIAADAADHNTPLQIAGTDWAQVATGFDHACALKTDHTIYCWGQNTSGELGRGTVTATGTPAQVVPNTSDWAEVATGYQFTCARKLTNAVYCWGKNDSNQAGDSGFGTPVLAPTAIPGLTASSIHTQNHTGTAYAFF